MWNGDQRDLKLSNIGDHRTLRVTCYGGSRSPLYTAVCLSWRLEICHHRPTKRLGSVRVNLESPGSTPVQGWESAVHVWMGAEVGVEDVHKITVIGESVVL